MNRPSFQTILRPLRYRSLSNAGKTPSNDRFVSLATLCDRLTASIGLPGCVFDRHPPAWIDSEAKHLRVTFS